MSREQAVESFAILRRRLQPVLDTVEAAAPHVGARRPIQAGGAQIGIGGAGGDRLEPGDRIGAVALAPGGEGADPAALDGPVTGTARGHRRLGARIGVVALQEIDPRHFLPPFGLRVGRQAGSRIEQRLRLGTAIVADERLHLRGQLGGDLIAAGVAAGTDASGSAVDPGQRARRGKRRQVDRTATGGDLHELRRFGEFGRLVEQAGKWIEIDTRRSVRGVQLGPGDRVERAGCQRVELQLRVLPAMFADGLEHGAIAGALIGGQQGRNRHARCGYRRRRNAARTFAHRRRCGFRCGNGRSGNRGQQQSAGDHQLAGHASKPPISNLKSFHASALR